MLGSFSVTSKSGGGLDTLVSSYLRLRVEGTYSFASQYRRLYSVGQAMHEGTNSELRYCSGRRLEHKVPVREQARVDQAWLRRWLCPGDVS